MGTPPSTPSHKDGPSISDKIYPLVRSINRNLEPCHLQDHVGLFFYSIARSLYNSQQNLCVDESMVKHKGHSDHVAYMPAKPCRWGLKVWVLAESVTGKCMPFHFLFQSAPPPPLHVIWVRVAKIEVKKQKQVFNPRQRPRRA